MCIQVQLQREPGESFAVIGNESIACSLPFETHALGKGRERKYKMLAEAMILLRPLRQMISLGTSYIFVE